MARWLWLVLPLAAFMGCMAIPRPHVRNDGPQEVVRGQLVFHSEFALPRQHRLLDELVALRTEIATQLGLPLTEEPIHVRLFETAEAFEGYALRNFPDFANRRAFFVETDEQRTVYAQWGERLGEDLRHEVAHGYLHASVKNLPLWLDEGLAEYFEAPPGKAGFNPAHVELLMHEQRMGRWQPKLERLEALRSAAGMSRLDYAEAWLWTHWLLHTSADRRQHLQNYLAGLNTDHMGSSLLPAVRSTSPDPVAELIDHLRRMPSAGETPK